MAYVSTEQYNDQRNLRDMIDGELNRIAVTDDPHEIGTMLEYLKTNIERYAQKHLDRIGDIYNPDVIKGGWVGDLE